MSINLLQRRRAMMAQKGGSLPYDSKVEYLGLDGNQYLSSGYRATNNSKLWMAFSYSVGTGFPLFGRSAASGIRVAAQCRGASATPQRFGDQSKSRSIPFSTSQMSLNSSHITVNGTNYAWDGAVSEFETTGDILIGWDGYASAKFHGVIRGFKFYENDVLIRDMIPVRVGQTGYLYDTVSGELFGNLGTGDFTLGPDVTQ